MDVLPAIDLRGGKVVRLRQGDYSRQTTYCSDPASVASRMAELGAKWIHVVDLDAARRGKPENLTAVRAIRQAAAVRIELGGGIRDEKTIDQMLNEVADRVVIGSAALKDWPWFEQLIRRRDDIRQRIALGLDARDGLLAAEGWTQNTELSAIELARRVRGWQLAAIVYTDIGRDGMLEGPNLQAITDVIRQTDVPVIASGGIHNLDDVIKCKRAGCAGVIIGRAYYEAAVDLARALELAEGD